jgi:hypothetical protein
MYVMAPEPISTACSINPSHQPVCMCIVDRQRLGKYIPAATNIHSNRRIVGRFVFYAVSVVPKESVGLGTNKHLVMGPYGAGN